MATRKKRQTIFDKALENIDETIRREQEASQTRVTGLLVAKQLLIDEQAAARRVAPGVAKLPEESSSSRRRHGRKPVAVAAADVSN